MPTKYDFIPFDFQYHWPFVSGQGMRDEEKLMQPNPDVYKLKRKGWYLLQASYFLKQFEYIWSFVRFVVRCLSPLIFVPMFALAGLIKFFELDRYLLRIFDIASEIIQNDVNIGAWINLAFGTVAAVLFVSNVLTSSMAYMLWNASNLTSLTISTVGYIMPRQINGYLNKFFNWLDVGSVFHKSDNTGSFDPNDEEQIHLVCAQGAGAAATTGVAVAALGVTNPLFLAPAAAAGIFSGIVVTYEYRNYCNRIASAALNQQNTTTYTQQENGFFAGLKASFMSAFGPDSASEISKTSNDKSVRVDLAV